MAFAGKTVFVSGGSRGIGLAIARRLARDGANVTIAAKTATPHPKLAGTIYTAVEEIEKAGGKGLPCVVDIRQPESVEKAIGETVDKFGGLDIVLNNASAISLTPTEKTSVKTYDLMNNINARGTWLVSKFALPHLLESASRSRNPHILTLAPPLERNLLPKHFGQATAYAMAKFGMSLCSLGLSGELQGRVGVNALWPYTLIDTEAIRLVTGEETRSACRHPELLAEAAHLMLSQPGSTYTGRFEVDEILLRKQAGWKTEDFSKYQSVKDEELLPDLFIPEGCDEEIAGLRRAD